MMSMGGEAPVSVSVFGVAISCVCACFWVCGRWGRCGSVGTQLEMRMWGVESVNVRVSEVEFGSVTL